MAATGLKVARVLAIRDGGVAEPVTYGNMAMESGPTVRTIGPLPPVSSGQNTSVVSVRVDFALDD